MTCNSLSIVFVLLCTITSFLTYRLLLGNKHLTITKKNDKGIRWASQSKPIYGGIGFFSAFITGLLFYYAAIDHEIISSTTFIALLSGAVLGLTTGIIDDTKSSSPNFKFAMQVLIGLVFIISGHYIHCFTNNWLNYFATIFWVVAFMNSINMLDNMDAISTSVSCVALGLMIAVGITGNSDNFMIFMCLSVILSLFVFLRWNWNPSKMYMGDNGSQFLGAFIAFASIELLWNHPTMTPSAFPIKEITIVIFAFIVPICDTTTVTINRLKAGKSPFVGGRDHTTHHLSYLGLSERRVALVLIAISLVFNVCAFSIIFSTQQPSLAQSFMWIGFAFLAFVGLYSTTFFAKPK